jgi:hypothetical protein
MKAHDLHIFVTLMPLLMGLLTGGCTAQLAAWGITMPQTAPVEATALAPSSPPLTGIFAPDSFAGSFTAVSAARRVQPGAAPATQQQVAYHMSSGITSARLESSLPPALPRSSAPRPAPAAIAPPAQIPNLANLSNLAALSTLSSLPAPGTRPVRRNRIASIPLTVADDAHAEGLLRRAAMLGVTYGNRMRLIPYGPDPAVVKAIADTAAAELMLYGVPESQLVINPPIVASAREARVDVVLEY